MTTIKKLLPLLALVTAHLSWYTARSQEPVKFISKASEHKVDVMVGGKYFTSYLYPDNIDKQVLYPLITASGVTVTRGFPLSPRGNERTDHPHHIGTWFNYGNVNGLDFWNNSYAIPDSAKPKYGSIRNPKILKTEDGKTKGTLQVTGDWVNQSGKVLLKENTSLVFSGDAQHRVIDRITTLTAQNEKIVFKDDKEGLLGIRVTRELELPADKPEVFTDAQGNPTKVPVMNNEGVTGNFLTSEGKTGNDAWGTRGKWCLMYGKKNNEAVSIAILDHPSNPGYPTYWHARGYGLFAANPLGGGIFSNGKEKNTNFTIDPGKSVTFRYRIVITNGSTPSAKDLDKIAAAFSSSSSLTRN